MTTLPTPSDVAAARARLLAAGATPKTFVCGPARDSDWSGASCHVSAAIDGQYAVGSGPTLDAAVTDLLAGSFRRPLLPTHAQLTLDGVA